MKKNGYVIKSINKHRMDAVIDWAAAEGWNPGLNDAENFYHTDPEGFFLGRLDGDPIGCISAIKYNKHFGFIGLHMVKPELRGQGYGVKLWDAALEYLGARNIGIDVMNGLQEVYKASGFRAAYRHLRYEGTGFDSGESLSKQIVPVKKVRFPALQAYDKAVFLAARPHFVKNWIEQDDCLAVGILNEEEHIAGYGVIRPCRVGFKIGPLFADNEGNAEALFQALIQHAAGAPITINVPEVSLAAIALVERFGMKPVSETVRMYSQDVLKLPIDRIFGISSVEQG